MTTPEHARQISPSQLPKAINTYLTAHQARDIDTAVRYYTHDATVVDEGNTYRGLDQIRDWLQRSASEYRDPPPCRQLPRRRRRPPVPVHTPRRAHRSTHHRTLTRSK
jgi:ketosteroid isomerase-like protein